MKLIDGEKKQMTAKEAVDALERIKAEAADEWIGNWEDYQAFDLAIQALQRSKWIPCSEDLPKTIGEYLITVLTNPHKNRVVSAGYYNSMLKEFGTYKMDGSWEKWDVVAWMPKPEPWKGAGDE